MSFTSTYSSLSSRGWQGSGTAFQIYTLIDTQAGPVPANVGGFTGTGYGYSTSISNTKPVGFDNNITITGAPEWEANGVITNIGATYITDYGFNNSSVQGANTGKQFGYFCAISADAKYFVASAPNLANQGYSNVYVADNSYNYTNQQQFISPYVGEFGQKVAINSTGNILALECWRDTVANIVNAGSVVIYNRSGNTWSETAKIYANDVSNTTGIGFGRSLSYDYTGNCLAVGANADANNSGALYIFNNNTQTAKIVASDRTSDDGFGTTCALSKNADYVVVGAYNADPASAGAAYVYANSANTWTEVAKLTGTTTTGTISNFGSQVCISDEGKTIVVADNDFRIGSTIRGSLFVFTKSENSWIQTQQIINPAAYSGTGLFAYDISMTPDGKKLAVTDINYKSGNTTLGVTYLYQSFF